ncbi:GntR family transcriptional regulator [Flavimaricola marinus]|uniref:Putative HTH-type transcriptional regulator YydK n=1 Tax=Flavimaricola marinus TaxID=1819565 RepID=A0A238LHL8_9RHOB|nr:GntR family transcriptional regulator [Flavimaricola marinus]SMY09128.1 putative HTH-type transcriptional regulator YydK [Flavimaricola marinus]
MPDIIAKSAALPKYVRISERLIREIAAGHLADGARLPPEREMAVDLGTSVGTLRKALADLEAKGLLLRIQGSGNYVRQQPETASVYAFLRLERAQGGGLPTADVLTVDRMPKPDGAPDFGRSDEAHRIRRLRRLDGEVVALEEIWLDGGQVRRIKADDLSESLYLYYRDKLGLVIARVEDRVGVEQVPEWTDPRFGPRAGDWAGFVERVSWSESGHRVEYSRTWFDKDKSRYISRMGKGV